MCSRSTRTSPAVFLPFVSETEVSISGPPPSGSDISAISRPVTDHCGVLPISGAFQVLILISSFSCGCYQSLIGSLLCVSTHLLRPCFLWEDDSYHARNCDEPCTPHQPGAGFAAMGGMAMEEPDLKRALRIRQESSRPTPLQRPPHLWGSPKP